MGFNRSHTADQQAWIADIMGVETSNMDADVAAQAAQRAMTRFVESLDLPTRLSQVGVTEDEFPALAKDALEDLIVATNPRPVESEETVVELLRSSL